MKKYDIKWDTKTKILFMLGVMLFLVVLVALHRHSVSNATAYTEQMPEPAAISVGMCESFSADCVMVYAGKHTYMIFEDGTVLLQRWEPMVGLDLSKWLEEPAIIQ